MSVMRLLNWWVRLRPLFPYPLLAIVQCGLLFAAVSRGLDYLIPPSGDSSTLTVVEGVAPLSMWGVLFLFFGILGLLGLHYPKTPLNAIGHGWCAVLYATFGFGSLVRLASEGQFSEWRTGIGWILVQGVSHWCIANAAWDRWREDKGLSCDTSR